MRAFTQLKLGIGAFYKPKSRDQRHAKNEAFRQEVLEAMRQDSAASAVSPATSEASMYSARCARAAASPATGEPGLTLETTVSATQAEEPSMDINVPTQAVTDEVSGLEASAGITDEKSQVDHTHPALQSEYDIGTGSGDLQVCREASYIRFDAEEPDDYTEGPARLIVGSDGVKDSAALLMTFDLSRMIQEAACAQRAYYRAEEASFEHRRALLQLEDDIEAKLASCRARLIEREEDQHADQPINDDLQQQHDILSLLLRDVQGRRSNVKSNLQYQADQLRERYESVHAVLGEAFSHANLIQSEVQDPVQPASALDLDTEYAAFREQLKGAFDNDGEYVAPPLQLSDRSEHLQLPSGEEQARQAIVERFWAGKDTLHQAHRQFEDRELTRAREYQANAEAAEQGLPTTDESPEAFDVRWVKRYQEITRALIDAEAAFAKFKAEMCEAGIELPPEDQTSIIYDRADDGYRMSLDQELIASIPSPVVHSWMSAVPDGVAEGLGSPKDVDEWDAEEVGISDSVSVVAEGSERRRIDRWRQLCST